MTRAGGRLTFSSVVKVDLTGVSGLTRVRDGPSVQTRKYGATDLFISREATIRLGNSFQVNFSPSRTYSEPTSSCTKTPWLRPSAQAMITAGSTGITCHPLTSGGKASPKPQMVPASPQTMEVTSDPGPFQFRPGAAQRKDAPVPLAYPVPVPSSQGHPTVETVIRPSGASFDSRWSHSSTRVICLPFKAAESKSSRENS